MRAIKFLIGIFIIIIILISFILLNTENGGDDNNLVYNNQIEENDNFNADEFFISNSTEVPDRILAEYQQVTENDKFYTIESIVQYYIYTIVNEKTEELFNILSKEYITDKNVTIDNVMKYVTSGLEEESSFTATQMYWVEGENIQTYSVSGQIWNNNKIIKEEYYIVEIDTMNSTFCITPCLNTNYASIKDINISKKIGNIEVNGNNIFYYKNFTTEEITKKYFKNFNKYMLYYPEKAYNALDKEYRDKKFGNIDNFKKYIEKNKYYIYRAVLSKYAEVNSKNSNIYIVKDNYNNFYKFIVNIPMQYTVLLDDYTIMTADDAKYYNDLDKFDKAKYNLSKFIKMVNTNDYKAVYSLLDDTFKANNFETVDQLAKYIENNFYNLNILEILDFDDETFDYIIFKCKITNMDNNNEIKNLIVVINVLDGTDFTMSFSIE